MTVDLTGYNVQVVQIVAVTANGKELGTELGFRDDFHKTYTIPGHTKPLSIRLVVTPGSEDGQSVDETRTSPVCGEESPSQSPSQAPSSSAPATAASTPAASSGTPSDTPSASTLSSPSASPSVSAPPLAETGASGSTPLIAGTAGAVVLAGAALLVATRRRRTAQH